ncbi:MAG: dihydroorotase [Flavobacteriaceae bacterium]
MSKRFTQMNVLLKAAKILDANSPHHQKTQDIYIENGVIKAIGKSLSYPKATQVSVKGLHVSQGWFDSNVSFGEPGFEERETIAHGLDVAAKSGFTHIAYNTNTLPKPDSRADITFLLKQAAGSAVQLHPKLALQYATDFGGLVESFPFNQDLANNGVMHEGVVSTSLGLGGIPSVVEELQLKRDLGVLHYAEGKLHVPTVSTAAAVQLIKAAKKAKLDVSCSVSIHNLFFTDEALQGFDANAKLLPPLRNAPDRKTLRTALLDGVIDMATSDHLPLNSELKAVELDRAHHGSLGLEHSFGCLLSLFTLEQTVELLTRGKQRFGIDEHPISEGATADLTLFSPKGNNKVTKSSLLSTSKNSIFIGHELSGTVYGVISQGKIQVYNI